MIITPDPIEERSALRKNGYQVVMIDAPDVVDDNVVEVGFNFLDDKAKPLAKAWLADIYALGDVDGTILTPNGNLNTARLGSIKSTEGLTLATVRADENGQFRCRFTFTGIATVEGVPVYFACRQAIAGPAVNCIEVDRVLFKISA